MTLRGSRHAPFLKKLACKVSLHSSSVEDRLSRIKRWAFYEYKVQGGGKEREKSKEIA